MRLIILYKSQLMETGHLIPQYIYSDPRLPRLYNHQYISYKGFINDAYVLLDTRVVYTDWYGYA